VIFDLAKPYGDIHGAASIAAAMEGGEKRNVRVAKPGIAGPPASPDVQEEEEDAAGPALARK